jgi:hypothetical protein
VRRYFWQSWWGEGLVVRLDFGNAQKSMLPG